jgi:uncharacterized membrane protein
MKTKLIHLWDSISTSFWFVPTLMTGGAVSLATGMVAFDETMNLSEIVPRGLLFLGGPEGARMLLSTIAGSMITVASLTFSITIVALTLTSSQFGPRLLRNFMRDAGNQVTLGTFIATFVYCLLVLRTVGGNGDGTFVPHASVTIALLLALTSLAVLIYFIHHVASAIQANNVVAAVGDELERAIVRLFPPRSRQQKEQEPRAETPVDLDRDGGPIFARRSGYVVAFDKEGLLRLATEKDFIFCVRCGAGDFVAQGKALVTVCPGSRIDDELFESINHAFILSEQGSPRQDVEFAIHQLVEIAVRALSPGINDPYTAVTCVDQLGVSLCRIAERDMPAYEEYDVDGKIRLILKPVTFSGIVDAAFNQIRQYGRSSVAVTIRLLEAIAIVATHAYRESDRSALLRHVRMIKSSSQEAPLIEEDRKDVEERYQAALEILEGDQAFFRRPARGN